LIAPRSIVRTGVSAIRYRELRRFRVSEPASGN
jgi:hypothetical protein